MQNMQILNENAELEKIYKRAVSASVVEDGKA